MEGSDGVKKQHVVDKHCGKYGKETGEYWILETKQYDLEGGDGAGRTRG